MTNSVLNTPFVVAGKTVQNRIVFQPMEGCDCNYDGAPSELTCEKYYKAAASGAGVIWFEANAVCAEGRTNPRQMMLTKENAPVFKTLLTKMRKIAAEAGFESPLMILQLTHSGRQSINPMIAYRHPLYEEKRPVSEGALVSDDYLDTLSAHYAASAILAGEVGFDGVDVKSCHGYLFQELLSAFTREGRYGGSFENRTRLYIDCIRAVKEVIPSDMLLTTRLGVSDMIPKPYGFGTNELGELDLCEPLMLIDRLVKEGVVMLNVTIGNPYYNPHINRPYRVGAYKAPESAEEGLKRFLTVEKAVKEAFPTLSVVGSGMSYYREDLMERSEELIREGVCDFVGYGRMTLAYPEFYRDYINGAFVSAKCCVACSKCTTLMRNGRVSGCAVFNETYKNIYKEIK